MTPTQEAAMRQALEALENPWAVGPEGVANAITALRAALEEPEPKTNCRRAICQRDPDGYCALCHERMYP